MSDSRIKNKWMREQMFAEKQHAMRRTGRHNPHRLDEAPKNRPSKYITTRCPNAAWLQESTSFGGHKIPKGGHRRVSGIVRAKTKEEIREEVQLEEDAYKEELEGQ